jgi:NADP-dependent 3-hydroxy acid dehydrogenase YdfG
MPNSCWITGASSGIGKYTALCFARNGYTVFASSRSLKDLNTLVQESLDSSFKGKIIALPLDVTVSEEIVNGIKFIEKETENLNFIILNAGTYIKEDSKYATIKSTKHMIDLNYIAIFNHIILLQPYISTLNIEQIAVVSSMAAWRGMPMSAAYSSSKAAIKTAIESFEIDYNNTGIRFRIFYPGFVKTPLTDKNDFKMPFLMDAEKAAKIVYEKLLYSKKFEVSFPLIFALIMRITTILPWPIYKMLMIKKMQK